jgi:hypothetical protein
MVKKDKKQRAGGKLLDAWKPPEGVGAPIGCVATSFTFSPVFFEEECLGRFLQMQSDAIEDGPVYIIEREEKLADIRCVSVLVDACHCKGARSLKWDLLPARIPKSILHAKISLLQWQHLVRVIVASANLTEDGYRRNQEIFGVIDFSEGSAAPIAYLDDIIEYLREIVGYADAGGSDNSPSLSRWRGFLDGLRASTNEWRLTSTDSGKKMPRIHAVLTGPGRPSVYEQIANVWPEGTPPIDAFVTSPFFDPPGIPNQPALKLWNHMRRRGEATVTYNVTAEEVPGQTSLFLHAPHEILEAEPQREAAKSYLCRLEERSDGKDSVHRPVHFKSIWLQGNDWLGHLIGSSNFTTRGLGISQNPNLEANIFYLVSRTGNPSAARQLTSQCPEGDPIYEDHLIWKPLSEKGEDAPGDHSIPLPAAFGAATFSKKDGMGEVIFHFTEAPPEKWRIFLTPESDEILIGEDTWKKNGTPKILSIEWAKNMAPSGFEVTWHDVEGRAWWPVNVDSAASLPPPEELQNLPLEVLIDILTSARPLHQVLKRWIQAKKEGSASDSHIDPYDPHKRVDTSGFLLQKTYRVSTALNGLRQKLQRPSTSEAALEWRLRGPVGVSEVARAITDEAKSNEEKAFLLTELALEIGRVQPMSGPGCMTVELVQKRLNEIIREIKQQAFENLTGSTATLRKYVASAFKELRV